jgi:hypothetical protein
MESVTELSDRSTDLANVLTLLDIKFCRQILDSLFQIHTPW